MEGIEGVIEAGTQITKTAAAGVKEATSVAGPAAEGIAQTTTSTTGAITEGIAQTGNVLSQEAVGGGIGIGAESLGGLSPSPVGRVEDTVAPAMGPELDLNNLSPGERAAEAAVKFGQANRAYTDGLRSGNINPDDAKRVSELRQELDELKLQQMKRSKESTDEEKDKDEEWEMVKRGNKVVIRRRRPGLKRAVGDLASNLAVDVANDASGK